MKFIHSYFEKGCRKKCTRQSRKVLWVVLSSPLITVQKNLKEWHERPRTVCLQVLKKSNKSRFDSYSVRNSVMITSHISLRDCRETAVFIFHLSWAYYEPMKWPGSSWIAGSIDWSAAPGSQRSGMAGIPASLKFFGLSFRSFIVAYLMVMIFSVFISLYYYMKNFCNFIGLEQWYFSVIWNTYMWKLQTFCR